MPVVDSGNDFGDLPDDEPRGPLLPPEDRLWRHPSELGSGLSCSDERVAAARSRWLQSTPSRAGAGAAGIVGALLATGVVLIGTHLTSWLTPIHAPRLSATPARASATTLTTLPAQISPSLEPAVAGVAAALVRVRIARDDSTTEVDGVFISPNGYVLVPARPLSSEMSLSVIRPDGEELVASIAGVDVGTGLAVLHVDGSGMPWLELSPARTTPTGTLAMAAWWNPDSASSTYCVGSLGGDPSPTSMGSGPALLQLWRSPLVLGTDPVGSIVVNSSGEVIAMVMAERNHGAVVAPGWLAGRIAGYLMTDGRFEHGWLGIEGATASLPTGFVASAPAHLLAHNSPMERSASLSGVRILAVMPHSAAARAGLEEGEVIESINGSHVSTMAELQAELYLMPPEAPVRLEVLSGTERQEVNARLQAAA